MSEANDKVQVVGEENFAEMFEDSVRGDESSVCEGRIVKFDGEFALVDVKRKSELLLDVEELKGADGELAFKEGDTLMVAFIGNGRVSHKKALVAQKVKAFIDAFDPEAENKLEVTFTQLRKNGDLVGYDENGVEFLMPSRQCGNREPAKVKGKTLLVKVTKVNVEKQEILVSRRRILDEERHRKEEALMKVKDSTEVINGIVRKVMSYGMFVDVGGVDGLVHYSQISYRGPVNPSALYKEGDVVPVKVIGFNEEKKQLSLSIKATLSDPWNEVEESLEVGDQIKVTVSNIEEYGAFVDLGNDVEGFLHISEVSWDKNTQDMHKYIKEGEEIDVEVIEINREKRRLRVSLKNLQPKPFETFKNAHKAGDVVRGRVVTLTDFGAFLAVEGVEGLLHNEDLSWNKDEKCRDSLKKGDELDVKIMRIDADAGKIAFSARALQDGPITLYAKSHNVGDIVRGVVEEIRDFGVFVRLAEDVDGLIRTEDLGKAGELKVGDEIESAIAFIDDVRNRIRLSVSRKERQAERNALNEFNSRANDDDKNSLGDLIRGVLK